MLAEAVVVEPVDLEHAGRGGHPVVHLPACRLAGLTRLLAVLPCLAGLRRLACLARLLAVLPGLLSGLAGTNPAGPATRAALHGGVGQDEVVAPTAEPGDVGIATGHV